MSGVDQRAEIRFSSHISTLVLKEVRSVDHHFHCELVAVLYNMAMSHNFRPNPSNPKILVLFMSFGGSLFGSDTQITHRRLVVLQLQAFVKVADADLLKRPLTFSLKSHTHRSHRSRSRFQNLLDKTWWAKRLHLLFPP